VPLRAPREVTDDVAVTDDSAIRTRTTPSRTTPLRSRLTAVKESDTAGGEVTVTYEVAVTHWLVRRSRTTSSVRRSRTTLLRSRLTAVKETRQEVKSELPRQEVKSELPMRSPSLIDSEARLCRGQWVRSGYRVQTLLRRRPGDSRRRRRDFAAAPVPWGASQSLVLYSGCHPKGPPLVLCPDARQGAVTVRLMSCA
jgi:hypothetical protein